MKNCKAIEAKLPLYLDNMLSSKDKQAIENHLKSCPSCTKALDQLQKTEKTLNNLGEVEPPVWFKQKIMAEVHREAEKKSFVQKWFYPLGIKIPIQVFTTLIIAVLAFYIYRAGNEQMKEALPLSIPAPVDEAQKEELPKLNQTGPQSATTIETKKKVAVDKDVRNEVRHESTSGAVASKTGEIKSELAREKVQQMDADAAKDESRQVASGIMADKYESRQAKSFELPSAKSEKKKESSLTESMNARSAPRAQSMIKQNVILKVVDIDTAVEDIEKFLAKNEAKNITRQMMPNKAILTAAIKNQKTKDFIIFLKKTGQVEGKIIPMDSNEQYVVIVIEIWGD